MVAARLVIGETRALLGRGWWLGGDTGHSGGGQPRIPGFAVASRCLA